MFDLIDIRYLTLITILVLTALIFLKLKFFRKEIKKEKTSFKLSGWTMIYSDARPDEKDDSVEYSTLLKSEELDVQGKPDFIFENKNMLMPVEIKSGSIKDEPLPHIGDLMQLAAYFAILEEEYGKKIKYGRLMYKDYMFTVYNTRKLRKELVHVLKDMRSMLDGKKVKVKGDYLKCRHCVCNKTVCEFCEK